MTTPVLYPAGTRYVAAAFDQTRGVPADITSVGMAFHIDPNHKPTLAEFTTVTLVEPGDPLADASIGDKLDILALIGPKAGADLALASGDWQAFTLIQTSSEDIIDHAGTVTVL